MNGGDQKYYGDDSAHRVQTIAGRSRPGSGPVPEVRPVATRRGICADNINSTAAMAFSGRQ